VLTPRHRRPGKKVFNKKNAEPDRPAETSGKNFEDCNVPKTGRTTVAHTLSERGWENQAEEKKTLEGHQQQILTGEEK